MAYFYIEIEDGSPISFSCQATFRGPIVNLVEPVIDLGLTKVNTTRTFQLTLQNKSPIPAAFIIKNAKNKRMNFYNAILHDTPTAGSVRTESKLSVASLLVGPTKSKKGNQFLFDAYHGMLAPNSTLRLSSLRTASTRRLSRSTMKSWSRTRSQSSSKSSVKSKCPRST